MKIRKLVFFQISSVLMLLLVLSACDNEATTPEDDNSALVGTWTVTSATTSNCNDASENETRAAICTTTDCLTVEFKADGTFVSTALEDGITDIDNGTYAVSGDQLTITQDGMSEVSTFSITGNTLTLNGNETGSGCDFSTSLTKN